jgi:hypothetical protein
LFELHFIGALMCEITLARNSLSDFRSRRQPAFALAGNSIENSNLSFERTFLTKKQSGVRNGNSEGRDEACEGQRG